MASSRTGVVVFFDLEAFSATYDPVQAELAQSLLDEVGRRCRELWPGAPQRSPGSPYLILPTGDGCALIIWEATEALPSRELCAVWLGGRLLGWADARSPHVGLRCGVNAGELDYVTDPYGSLNVTGATINIAQRILDAANPGQLLAHHDNVTRRLAAPGPVTASGLRFELEPPGDDAYEIVAKHGRLVAVKSVVGHFVGPGGAAGFGQASPPREKWYLQVEPPILYVDRFGERKVPPVALLTRHQRMAFVGATNDQLAPHIEAAWAQRGGRPWELARVYFLVDASLEPLATKERSWGQLCEEKRKAIDALRRALSGRVARLDLLEYRNPYYFASYWDWDAPGGRIHVSPYIWGQDVRICPALDYTWRSRKPSMPYESYRLGLSGLHGESNPIAI